MRKLSITLAAAAFALSMTALTVNAQTQGASTLNAQARNATLIQKTACGPRLFAGCPWGTRRVCGPYRCWCAPC